jgi:hypothetical protein
VRALSFNFDIYTYFQKNCPNGLIKQIYMHFLALSISYQYSIKQFRPSFLKTQFSGNSRSGLTNIDGKACNNIQEAVNKFA